MSAAPRHIAVIAPPTPGHMAPLQALGESLLAIGHQVTFVHVGEAERFVTLPGIGFAAVPAEPGMLAAYLQRLARPTGPIGLQAMIRATGAMTQTLFDQAPTVLERIGADAVLSDTAEAGSALIAARLDLPHVATVTGLPLLEEESVPPPYLGWSYRTDRRGRFRNRGGYAVSRLLMRPITRTVENQRRAWGIAPEALAPSAYVAQCPQGLDYPRKALPPGFHYGGPWRREDDATADLPDDGRPLIFCSLGSLQGARRSLFATMAQACAAIGARAVIGHGGGLSDEAAATLPGDPLVRAFWPQAWVLRHAAAAVLHGGFNTVLDALAAGVPIVCLPIAFEQPGTAARLARIGAAQVLPPARLTVPVLVQALEAVLRTPGYRQAAQALAAEMARSGGAAEAAATVSAALTRAP